MRADQNMTNEIVMEKKGKVEGFLMKVVKILAISFLILLMAGALHFVFGKFFLEEKGESSATKTKVDVVVLRERLDAIGDFATYQYSYTGRNTIHNAREVFGFRIGFTEHSITCTYDGIIKVGYKGEDIRVQVGRNTIFVFLPEAEVLVNYIDSVSKEEHNNILNPIKSNEMDQWLDFAKELHLLAAQEEGIYDLAKKNAMILIKKMFSEFKDYKVVFF